MGYWVGRTTEGEQNSLKLSLGGLRLGMLGKRRNSIVTEEQRCGGCRLDFCLCLRL